jgi:endonuclease-8
VPEGDTLFRIAAVLGPPLTGKPVLALLLPRSGRRCDRLVGHKVTRVEARGKNLLVFFDEGSVLHTHLRMNGVWHLYREGEPWRRGTSDAAVMLRVPGWEAVCFRAPVVRLLRAAALGSDAYVGGLGPDLLGETFDEAEAFRRLREGNALALGEALMDQRVVAGIGNVYKSEILFHERLDPFAPVGAYSDDELHRMLAFARKIMRANVTPVPDPSGGPVAHYRYRRRTTRGPSLRGGGPLAVYRRARRPCFDCGNDIRMERQGEARRSTYYCPFCQPRRDGPVKP